MKFIVNALDLTKILKTVMKGYDAKETESSACLEVTPDSLILTASCSQAHFMGKIPHIEIDTDKDSTFYLHGLTLKQLAGIIPSSDTKITFDFVEKSRVFNISYTGHKFKLPIESDFSPKPKPKLTKIGHIQASDFISTMNDLLKIVDSDPTSSEVPTSCLHLTFEDSELRFFATDQFAMSEIIHPYTELNEDKHEILIKHQQAFLLNKQYLTGEVLTLVKTNSQFGYIDNDGTVSLVNFSALDPLDYSPHKGVAGGDKTVTVTKDTLRKAIDTVSKLSFDDEIVNFNFNIKKNILNVLNSANNEIEVPLLDNENMTDLSLSYERTHILNAMVPVLTDEVMFKFGDEIREGTGAYMAKVSPINQSGDEVTNTFIAVMSKMIE